MRRAMPAIAAGVAGGASPFKIAGNYVPEWRCRQRAYRCRGIGLGERLLILLPLQFDFLALGGRHFSHRHIFIACRAPLFRGQLGPVAHAFLQALLFIRFHLRIGIRNLDPFLPARRVEFAPLVLERRQHLLLRGLQLRPVRFRRLGLRGIDAADAVPIRPKKSITARNALAMLQSRCRDKRRSAVRRTAGSHRFPQCHCLCIATCQ